MLWYLWQYWCYDDYDYDESHNSAMWDDCNSCNKLYEYDEYIKCDITNKDWNCEACDNSKRCDDCDRNDDLSNGELHVDTAKDKVWPGLAIEGGLALIVTLK